MALPPGIPTEITNFNPGALLSNTGGGGTIIPRFEFRTTVQLPAAQISEAIRLACRYTAEQLANDYRNYLLLRFSERKSGKLWQRPDGTWYRASAPGEYPAIRYGILYRSMYVTRARMIGPDHAQCYVGARPFPGSSYGERNDPIYARELEGLAGPGNIRPYFVRAFDETRADRPGDARVHFLSYLYGRTEAAARRRGGAGALGIPNVAPGTNPMDLMPLLGQTNFNTISAGLRSGSATASSPFRV